MLRKFADGRTGSRAVRRLWYCCPSARLPVCLLIAACANAGYPPGGPLDTRAPFVDSVKPESGAVLTTPPTEATIFLDEVVNERTIGQPPDLSSAVLLSPATGPVNVTWHRDRITVRPKSGFKPDRIYHIELFPIITDLSNNRMRAGRRFVFSTGPEIPNGRIAGTTVDWVGGKPAPRSLVEAILMPDSLVYRVLTDSGGVFQMSQLPIGHYVVYGIMDTNNDHRRGARESYDSASVDVDTVAHPLELFAFAHDTTGPRIRQVEAVDSVTLKITFDRPLDPTLALDTSMVRVAPLADSTSFLPITAVLTQKGMDSIKTRTADSITAARTAAQDSTRAAADSTRRAAPDTTRRAQPDTTRRARPDTTRRDTTRRDTTRQVGRRPAPDTSRRLTMLDTLRRGGRAPLDSTRAEKMLARHPPPTDTRIVIMAAALTPETRYLVYVDGARSLSGNPNNARGPLRMPKAKPVPPPRDTTQARPARDTSTVRDTTVRDTTVRDTTRARPSRRP